MCFLLCRRKPGLKTRKFFETTVTYTFSCSLRQERYNPRRTNPQGDSVSLSSQRVTALLSAWREGHQDAEHRLFDLVYKDLRRVAARYMAHERPEHTLQATALVNEAYLRLIDIERIQWRDRSHFLAVAARVMRRILVDNARAHRAHKRGSGAQNVSLDEALLVTRNYGPDLVALDEALSGLASLDERQSKVVELRFFGGLGVDETAEVLGVSSDTVLRDWKMAKVWLLREIKRGNSRPPRGG
jgi:RNA polymerase sigma factor (TIGR02999 family)